MEELKGKEEPTEEEEPIEDEDEYNFEPYSPPDRDEACTDEYEPYYPRHSKPHPPVNGPTRWSSAIIYSDQAIKHYNENHKNDEFELVHPLYYKTFYVEDEKQSYLHLNFIAKNKSSSKLKLFFADFTRSDKCLKCVIVEPGNPLFEVGCCAGCQSSGVMYHPSLELQMWAPQEGFHRLDIYEESAKQLMREAYIIKSTVQELNTEEANKLKNTYHAYVLEAIKKYNRKKRASFKHLETVYCVRFRHTLYTGQGIFWVHLIFKAKDEGPNCINKSPVLFFAQVGLDSYSLTCVPMPHTDFGSFPADKTSCGVCSMLPKGTYADCKKGTFADSLWNGWCWAVKSELEEAGDANHTATAWNEHREYMERTEQTMF